MLFSKLTIEFMRRFEGKSFHTLIVFLEQRGK
jgi:hypothetical protein